MIIQAKSALVGGLLRENIWVEIVDGLISSINSGKPSRADHVIEGALVPGFIDMHCHGGGGFYFSSSEPSEIEIAIQTHNSHGTTSVMASLVTAPLEVIKSQIQRLVPYVKSGQILGIHLEGPYLSHARCGAHEPSFLREPRITELADLLSVGEGCVKMVTLAPELPGAIEAIEYLVSRGVKVAIGHSAADFGGALQGVVAGATIVTHFPNAVSKMDDEGSTLADLAMKDGRLYLELILDGHHVNDETVRRIYQVASDRIALVTDAMSAAGKSDGHYFIGQLPVTVKDSVARLDSNGALAGSTLTMDRSFFNLQSQLGYSLAQAVFATSQVPARALGLYDRGEIAVGRRADLLEVEAKDERISVVPVG